MKRVTRSSPEYRRGLCENTVAVTAAFFSRQDRLSRWRLRCGIDGGFDLLRYVREAGEAFTAARMARFHSAKRDGDWEESVQRFAAWLQSHPPVTVDLLTQTAIEIIDEISGQSEEEKKIEVEP